MQAERVGGQSWRIYVTAKANDFNFRFRFRATSSSPTWSWTLCRYSIALKLRKFVFRINSKRREQIAKPKMGAGFMRTKVIKVFKKFRVRFTNSRPNDYIGVRRASNLGPPKDPVNMGFWVMGFLAFLSQTISKKDQKGIMILASVGFFVLASFNQKFKTGKLMKTAAVLLVAAATVYYLYFNFDSKC